MHKSLNRIFTLSSQFKINFSTSAESPVLLSQETPYFAKCTLNKPKTLNALDLDMIEIINNQVPKWNESQTKAVWFHGAGGKAFCAGGDIKSLYDARKSGDEKQLQHLDTFFRQEFTGDWLVTNMKPTQISLYDGIVMGGGVGVSINSKIKIATEKATFAMPEARIAFFTDVAGGFFLSRLKKNIGMFLGLTGERLKGEQLVQTGIATHFVKGENIKDLEAAIIQKTDQNTTEQQLKEIVGSFASDINLDYQNENQINEIFKPDNFEQFYQRVQEAQNTEFGQKVLKNLSQQNSISVRIIFEQIKKGINMNYRENLISDYGLTQRFMNDNDFYEGVRIVLVDRNDKPKWTYASPLDVPQEVIDFYFTPLAQDKILKI